MSELKPWIGVDFDGTLAYYGGTPGVEALGEPVPKMVTTVKTILAAGNTVKIVTARAADPASVPLIKAWCLTHLGVELEVTDRKDFAMICLYDDRARQVVSNTGITMDEVLKEAKEDRNGFQQFFLALASHFEFPLGSTPSVQEDITALFEKITHDNS